MPPQAAGGFSSDKKLPAVDLTLPGTPLRIGHLHPITQTIDELKDIMGRLGFTVAAGPKSKTSGTTSRRSTFRPPIRPAIRWKISISPRPSGRRPGGRRARLPLLLRSQTSTVQIRVMEKTPPPVRIISLGRVYRPDTADATHYPMFHQIEGLLVDRQVTMADLKSVLRLFAQLFGKRRPHSLSPFVLSVHRAQRGSRHELARPSRLRWVEMGGAGMVDPNVLRAVGYDPEEVTGFAFGLGVERVCARRHGVTDIREFYKNDVRFLHQF